MKLVQAANLNQRIRLKNSIGVRYGIKGLDALIHICNPHLGRILVHPRKKGGGVVIFAPKPLTMPVPAWPLRLVTWGAPLPAKTIAVWPAKVKLGAPLTKPNLYAMMVPDVGAKLHTCQNTFNSAKEFPWVLTRCNRLQAGSWLLR
jgi:hypothetical protein